MNTKKLFASVIAAGLIMSFAPLSSFAATGWSGNSGDGWRYCTDDSGYVTDDWKLIDGLWYYFNEDGYALTDTWAFVSGKLYHFDKYGVMERNKWIECGDNSFSSDPQYKDLKNWRYVGPDGAAYTGWKNVNGNWYYFSPYMSMDGFFAISYACIPYGLFTLGDYHYFCDRSGKMVSDCWQKIDSKWMYFGSDGKACVGWHKIHGKWYYFKYNAGVPVLKTGIFSTDKSTDIDIWITDDDGALISSRGLYQYKSDVFYDGTYYIKSDGSCLRNSWMEIDGNMRYFGYTGQMVCDLNNIFIDGKFYDFDEDGICRNYTEAKKADAGFYHMSEDNCFILSGLTRQCDIYVGEDGQLYRDKWLDVDGNHYYFDEDGIQLKSGNFMIDDRSYKFDAKGICTNYDYQYDEGWNEINGDWYYIASDGRYYIGWHKINNVWYYFFYSGSMMENGRYYIDDEFYYFNKSGAMLTGWQMYCNYWVYAGSNGKLYSNKWLNYNGKWYYFNGNCAMVENRTDYLIDGRAYDFDSEGVCLNPYNGRNFIVK